MGAHTMKLQFTHQDYQSQAVQAVTQIFDGQPLAASHFSLVGENASVEFAPDGTIGNRLGLSEEQLLANLQKVQQANGIPLSETLDVESWTAENLLGETVDRSCPHFSIDMETGTGKTYTFIKTIYELNKLYGYKKFVVVVPSVAIREGTMKNLEVTHTHFAASYPGVPCVPTLYNSRRLQELRNFAQSDALSILVLNIDSFTKDSNKINQQGERAFAPIEYIRSTRPIVIIDEPQNFETPIRRKAIQDLYPLCTVRYSATHKNTYNLLYSLGPVQAYDLGLVKQIEVDGVEADASHNTAFVELVKVESKARSMIATVKIDVDRTSGTKRETIAIKLGDDLAEKSRGRSHYAQGFVLNEFLSDKEIRFSNGRVVAVNEVHDELLDPTMQHQIRRTVAAHFEKVKRLRPLGIKVLSLFFIDKVANYRSYDDEGNSVSGKFALWFEQAFNEFANQSRYHGLIPHSAEAVHNGYFSQDRKGKGDAAKTWWVDSTERGSKRDDTTYELIMREKERLLSLDEPLQFIFSHSALREGWDNPNVFQICTLNETKSVLKKRQEIGRGLRLAVNQQGERVHDKDINVLTVIPNESYEAFALSLQAEIEEDTGDSFTGRVKNRRERVSVRRRQLNTEEDALFQAIWRKINFQTRYSVVLDTPELIHRSVALLRDTGQYPKVQEPKIHSRRARFQIDETGIQTQETSIDSFSGARPKYPVPDVYAYLQERVSLSRSTLFTILDQSGRLQELLINPQSFLDMAVSAIQSTLQELMVEGIEYHRINGRNYEMKLFDDKIEAYESSLYPPANDPNFAELQKTLLTAHPIGAEEDEGGRNCILKDSDVESEFARDCSNDERVRFFFKLPRMFRIDTPLGAYNPDWAVVFENDERVYFVAETKSSPLEKDRRPEENLKIRCGEKHFALSEDVTFKVVNKLEKLVP